MKTNVDLVYVKRIRAGSLAALVFSGTAMLMIPMSVLFGILAWAGMHTVHVNGSYVTGIGGFLLSLVYAVLFTGIFGLMAWPAAYLGILVVGHFRPFRLEYVAPEEAPPVLPPAPPPVS